MSKVTAPLFSFTARGALAKSIVYFPWKGVAAVRSYVVPANPNTAAQATQRGYMTSSVAEWHGASYNTLDVAAWNRLANLLATSLSGFNRMVQEWVNEVLLGNTWERMSAWSNPGLAATTIDTAIQKAAAGNAPTIRWGTSPTNMPNNAPMVDVGDGTWTYQITGLTASTLYYISADVGASGADWGRLGIYTARTTA